MEHNLTSPLALHLKVDTGFHRYGISPDEIPLAIEIIRNLKKCRVEWVYSHVAWNSDPTHQHKIQKQIQLFEDMVKTIEEGIGYNVKRHLLSTGGITQYHKYKYEGVRVGIGLHGYSPDPTHIPYLKNPYSLKAPITHIKKIRKGEGAGYDSSFVAHEDMTLGIIQIGYADGIPINAHKKNVVFYFEGKPLRVVTRPCMDTTFLDVSSTPGIYEGAMVEVFGDNSQPYYKLALQCETIPYALLCSISERVKRIYVKK